MYSFHIHPTDPRLYYCQYGFSLVMPVSWVDGHPFVDGGIREVAPIHQ